MHVDRIAKPSNLFSFVRILRAPCVKMDRKTVAYRKGNCNNLKMVWPRSTPTFIVSTCRARFFLSTKVRTTVVIIARLSRTILSLLSLIFRVGGSRTCTRRGYQWFETGRCEIFVSIHEKERTCARKTYGRNESGKLIYTPSGEFREIAAAHWTNIGLRKSLCFHECVRFVLVFVGHFLQHWRRSEARGGGQARIRSRGTNAFPAYAIAVYLRCPRARPVRIKFIEIHSLKLSSSPYFLFLPLNI